MRTQNYICRLLKRNKERRGGGGGEGRRRKKLAAPYIKESVYVLLGGIVQELCESRGGRPGLSVLTSLLVSVDVKIY